MLISNDEQMDTIKTELLCMSRHQTAFNIVGVTRPGLMMRSSEKMFIDLAVYLQKRHAHDRERERETTT